MKNKLDFYDLYDMGYVWINCQDVIDKLGNSGVRYTLKNDLQKNKRKIY